MTKVNKEIFKIRNKKSFKILRGLGSKFKTQIL